MATVTDILNTLFDHIENKHKAPIEKLKLLINHYDQEQKEASTIENERQTKYVEHFEAKRHMQNEMYKAFLADRQELYDKWVANKSKDTLYELINMQYKMEDIPDIYTGTVFNIKKLNEKKPSEKPVEQKPVEKPVNKKQVEKKPVEKPVNKKQVEKKPLEKQAEKPIEKPQQVEKAYIQCGIQNLGNSCYINSTLQYLIHLPAFNNIMLKHNNSSNAVVKAYIELYTAYNNKNVEENDIEKLVNNLNETLNDGDKFDVTSQEDASEFMMKFLEKLDIQELVHLFEVETELKIDFDKTIKKGNKDLKCNDEKEIQPIIDTSVILKFPDKKAVYNIGTELTKAYDGISEEVTKKGDFIECNNVTVSETEKRINKIEKFPYTRREKLTKFPQVLKIALNIFDNKLKKVFIKSEIPNVWEYGAHQYKLNGIIVHKGETMSSGHYEYFSLEDKVWYEYSDTIVNKYKPVKPKASYYNLSTDDTIPNVFYTNKSIPCPYILCYVRH
jgi:ubiquitin C-terminal hydrolase